MIDPNLSALAEEASKTPFDQEGSANKDGKKEKKHKAESGEEAMKTEKSNKLDIRSMCVVACVVAYCHCCCSWHRAFFFCPRLHLVLFLPKCTRSIYRLPSAYFFLVFVVNFVISREFPKICSDSRTHPISHMCRVAGLLCSETSAAAPVKWKAQNDDKSVGDSEEKEEEEEEEGRESKKYDEDGEESDEDSNEIAWKEVVEVDDSALGRAPKPQSSSTVVASKHARVNETSDNELSEKSSDDDDGPNAVAGSKRVGGIWSPDSDDDTDDGDGESVLLPVGYVAPPWLKASKKVKSSLPVGKARSKTNASTSKSTTKSTSSSAAPATFKPAGDASFAREGGSGERATKALKRPATDEADELNASGGSKKVRQDGPEVPSSAGHSYVVAPLLAGLTAGSQEVKSHEKSTAGASKKNGNKRPRGKRGGGKHKK